jgi:hypothetical protein
MKPLSAFRRTCIEIQLELPNGFDIQRIGIYYIAFYLRRCVWLFLQVLAETEPGLIPNPLCTRAAGRPIYSVPFIVFVDDVSGNQSKQWNKHWCCYVSNASLPREEINWRATTKFMCTTQHASPLEMLHGIKHNFSWVYALTSTLKC